MPSVNLYVLMCTCAANSVCFRSALAVDIDALIGCLPDYQWIFEQCCKFGETWAAERFAAKMDRDFLVRTMFQRLLVSCEIGTVKWFLKHFAVVRNELTDMFNGLMFHATADRWQSDDEHDMIVNHLAEAYGLQCAAFPADSNAHKWLRARLPRKKRMRKN